MVIVASCSGALKNFKILQYNLKLPATWLKLGHNWVFQQDKDPKHTSDLDVK